ncbi:MAG: hypothetical protein ACYDEB_10620 [Dehalococcoidia bacterium]
MNIPVILGVLIALGMLAALALMALDTYGWAPMRSLRRRSDGEPPLPRGKERDAP